MMSKNQELFGRATQSLPGGNVRTTLFVPPSAPYLVEGTGARVRDLDGHVTIDCNNNYTSLIHGHRPTPVLEAVRKTLEWGISFGLPTPVEVQMAEVLRERMPHIDQWRFGNSGTEAIMQAIRIARASTGRDVIVRFTGAYHGTSDAVVDPAAPGIPRNITDVVKNIPYGDGDAFLETMRIHGENVAAVLVDLMPNRAGLNPATPEFAAMLRAVTTDYGALLVVDEVISFRLGEGGFQQRYGIKPDLTTLGKVIGGGFPIGAVGGIENVMRVTDPRESGHLAWGGTFSANPVSLTAGIATLAAFRQQDIDELNTRGEKLREQLLEAGLRITGSGSLLRIWPADDESVQSMWWRLYRAGVQVGSGGLLALSTVMSDEDISDIGTRVIETLA